VAFHKTAPTFATAITHIICGGAVFVSSRRPEKTGRTGKEKTSFILNADGIFLNSVFRVCFSETCGFARHSNVSLQG